MRKMNIRLIVNSSERWRDEQRRGVHLRQLRILRSNQENLSQPDEEYDRKMPLFVHCLPRSPAI